MARHLRLCAVVFAATAALLASLDLASGRAGPASKKIALVVGINKYHHGGLGELQFAEADARDLADLLQKAGYEFTLLTGDKATLPAIRAELVRLRKLPGADGLFLVALAGHGMQPADAQEAYFIPYDADQRVLKPDEKDKFPWDEKTLLPLSEVLGHLQASSAGARALLVDACRNDPSSGRGRGVGTGLKFADLPKNTAVLLSCSENQRAYEDKAWGGGHGAFFYQVLEGLKGQAVDKRGRVTANRLYEHLNDTVPDEVAKVIQAKQKPFQFISGDVDLGIDPKATETVQDLPKTLTVKLGDGVEMELVLLNAKGNAEFQMGAPKDDKDALDAEKPQHKVTLTKPFYLGKYHVTRGQFAAFVKATGYKTEAETGDGAGGYNEKGDYVNSKDFSWKKTGFRQTDEHPVVNVSWNDAKRFCRWLAEDADVQRQLKAKAGDRKMTVRLPSEAEWEYACRAGTTTAYFFGDDPKKLGDYAWYWDNSDHRTHRVGEKGKPNPWGLHDMHGNAFQWCEDYYDKEFYANSPLKDPLNLQKNDEDRRVLRGGSLVCPLRRCRAAYRYDGEASTRHIAIGFRVAFRPD
jgi:formylglycine-generating enzyme required for sulfatase activity